MKKKLLLSILVIAIMALLSIPFFIKKKAMHIDVETVDRIECSIGQYIIGKYSDVGDMTAIVNFLNSFVLTKRYDIIDCQRMSTDIVVYYKDGRTEHIEYRYTSLVYRGKGYEINSDKTYELDRLLYPNLER